MRKDVMIVIGAGQIGMAIARRVGFDKKVVIGDKNFENAKDIAQIMQSAGFDAVFSQVDLSCRESILSFIKFAENFGLSRGLGSLLR